MKIVINDCHGGFGISKEAMDFMSERGNKQAEAELEEYTGRYCGGGVSKKFDYRYKRDDSDLIEAVKQLRKKANGDHASLKIVEIPDGIDWEIDEYDGMEWVAEKHRKWYAD